MSFGLLVALTVLAAPPKKPSPPKPPPAPVLPSPGTDAAGILHLWTYEQFEAAVLHHDGPAVALFTAPGRFCDPCARVVPGVEAVGAKLGDSARFVRVDLPPLGTDPRLDKLLALTVSMSSRPYEPARPTERIEQPPLVVVYDRGKELRRIRPLESGDAYLEAGIQEALALPKAAEARESASSGLRALYELKDAASGLSDRTSWRAIAEKSGKRYQQKVGLTTAACTTHVSWSMMDEKFFGGFLLPGNDTPEDVDLTLFTSSTDVEARCAFGVFEGGGTYFDVPLASLDLERAPIIAPASGAWPACAGGEWRRSFSLRFSSAADAERAAAGIRAAAVSCGAATAPSPNARSGGPPQTTFRDGLSILHPASDAALEQEIHAPGVAAVLVTVPGRGCEACWRASGAFQDLASALQGRVRFARVVAPDRGASFGLRVARVPALMLYLDGEESLRIEEWSDTLVAESVGAAAACGSVRREDFGRRLDAQLAAWRSLDGFDPEPVLRDASCVKLTELDQSKLALLRVMRDFFDGRSITAERILAVTKRTPAEVLNAAVAADDPLGDLFFPR